MSITVYSKPRCVQCTATYRHLDRYGLAYDVVDISLPENADALAELKAEGYLQAPVVSVNDGGERRLWGGYRPDLIDGLVA